MRHVLACVLAGALVFCAVAQEPSTPSVASASKQKNDLSSSSDISGLPDFSAVVRKKAPALFAVGHPKCGTATAFCINRKHRLLVAAAHVADNRIQYGALFAVRNGVIAHGGTWSAKGTWYEVEDVWYSPNLGRDPQKRRPGAKYDPIRQPSADVAILKLKSDGPDLPEEFQLADPNIHALQAKPVGTLGFPAYAVRRVGLPQLYDRVNAVFFQGHVSRERGFYDGYGDLEGLFEKEGEGRKTALELTVPFWPGQSGSPIFLSDGRVIGVHVHYWKHEIPEQDGSTVHVRVSTAMHVRYIWECIQHKDYPLREYFGLSAEISQR